MPKPLKADKKTSSDDLFAESPAKARSTGATSRGSARGGNAEAGYTAANIKVLEGLEAVRLRPGMYVGGTDEKAMHHLFAEVIDNAMDEALNDHATFIDVEVTADGFVTDAANPNGSLLNIAGIANEGGNVVGLMPHPERAAEAELPSQDGLPLLDALIRSGNSHAKRSAVGQAIGVAAGAGVSSR